MRDMPEFQCTVPILRMQRNPSLAREKSGKSVADFARHNSLNPRGLCCEAAPEERTSISTTINRDLTHLNDSFDSPESGAALWEDICGRAYRTQHKKDGGTYRKRCGEADTISVGFILHPPSYVTAGWDEATALDFERDALDSMNDVMTELGRPRIFCEENLVGRYFHWDEGDSEASAEYAGLGLNPRDLGQGTDDPATIQGWHAHEFCMCQDPETGRWVGKQMDAMFRARLARDFPRLMRERGWPVLDNEVTDYSKLSRQHRAKDAQGHYLRREDGSYVMEDNPDYDPDYAARRKRRARRQGRSQNEFHSEQVARNLLRASDQLSGQNARLKSENDDLAAQNARAKEGLAANLADLDDVIDTLDKYREYAKKAEGEADDIRENAKAEAELVTSQAKHQAERSLAEADAIYADVVAEADGIELDAHLSAAGEEEAARQLSDSIEDRLDAVSAIGDEAALDAQRSQAALAAATRRREDEERRAREAEAARRAADKARAQAVTERDRALADKRRVEADAAEASRLASELDRLRADTAKARADASAAAKQRDKARADAKQADADRAAAAKRRDSVKAAADDARKAQAEAEELAKEARKGYAEAAAGVSAKQEEYRKVEDAVAARRQDLDVATRRGSLKLSEVASKVVDVCADALDAVAPKAAQWLRDRADGLRERAIDAIAPETRARALADYDEPDDDDTQDDYELEG